MMFILIYSVNFLIHMQ